MTLSLEKGFKRSISYNFTGDDAIEEKLREHAAKHEFADIQWYPSRHTAVYRNDDRVPLNTSGDGVNDFIGFQSNSILVSKSVRTTGNINIFSSSFHTTYYIYTQILIHLA